MNMFHIVRHPITSFDIAISNVILPSVHYNAYSSISKLGKDESIQLAIQESVKF